MVYYFENTKQIVSVSYRHIISNAQLSMTLRFW